jgi:hypothetical protein
VESHLEYAWAVQTVNEIADPKSCISTKIYIVIIISHYYAALEYVAIIYVNVH